MDVSYQLFAGQDLYAWIECIGQWRIDTFCHFPYLYSGNIENEQKYMRAFASGSNAFLCVAFVANAPVGIITASPLLTDKSIAKGSPAEAFQHKGLNPAEYFYLGEVIVLPEFRGAGVGIELLRRAEQEVQRRKFSHLALLCVERSEQHPLRPKDYSAPDPLWIRMGFQKTEMKMEFEWLAFEPSGLDRLQKHMMVFWTK